MWSGASLPRRQNCRRRCTVAWPQQATDSTWSRYAYYILHLTFYAIAVLWLVRLDAAAHRPYPNFVACLNFRVTITFIFSINTIFLLFNFSSTFEPT